MANETTGNSLRNFTRYQWTVLLTFAIVNIVSAMTYSIQAPFYPAEAESKNATAFEYGLVFGSYELTAFIMCPLLGSYMYLIGPTNGFCAGVLIAGTSMILFGFLNRITRTTEFVIFSIFLRVMQGMGTSALFVSIYSFVTHIFPNSIATTFAIMETAFGFGLCIGPVVGEFFFQIGGYTLPFVVLGGFLVLSPVVSHFVLKKSRGALNRETDEANNNVSRFGGIFHLIRIPAILLNIFGTFIGGFTLGFLIASLEPHIRQFNLSATLTGFMFLSYGAVYSISGPLIGSFCDRMLHPQYVTLAGSTLVFISFLVVGPAPFVPLKPTIWLTLAGLLEFGLGLSCLYVSTFLLTLREAKKHGYPDNVATHGIVSGLWMGTLSLGSFAGPIVAGFLEDEFQFRKATYCILALTFSLMCMLVVSTIKRFASRGLRLGIDVDGRSLLDSETEIWNDENIGESVQ